MKPSTNNALRTHSVLVIAPPHEQAELRDVLSAALPDVEFACHTELSDTEMADGLRRRWDVIVSAYSNTGHSIADGLRIIRDRHPETAVIVAAETGTIQDAVDVMRLGARGFVEKSDPQRLVSLIRLELEAKQAPRPAAEFANLHELLDTMRDAVCSIDLRERRLIYESAAFAQVFGTPLASFPDHPNFF